MNLAIEYIQRTRLSQQLLKLPCSLFLTNVFDQTRIAVTLQNCYGKPDEVWVKHWRLDRVVKDKVLPPIDEFVVNRPSLFASPFVVVEDYSINEYAANPYPIHAKQSADEPYASAQEKQYHECLDRFFNSVPNEGRRKNWLWKSFMTSFFPETMASEFGKMPSEQQRDCVQDLCPVPWKAWCMWLTHMFCDTPSPLAAELTFAPLFRDRLKANAKYQELIKPQKVKTTLPKEKNSSFMYFTTNSPAAGGWTPTVVPVDGWDTSTMTYTDS
jgi:hypothetical protein